MNKLEIDIKWNGKIISSSNVDVDVNSHEFVDTLGVKVPPVDELNLIDKFTSTFREDRKSAEETFHRWLDIIKATRQERTEFFSNLYPSVSKRADGLITMRLVSSDRLNKHMNDRIRERIQGRRDSRELVSADIVIGRWL
jgi:hypothetical protein